MNTLKKLSINGITNVIRDLFGKASSGGLYYPNTANPIDVGAYSILITDAVGLYTSKRTFVIAGGNPVSLRSSHVAGSTVYRVSNTYANRITLNSCKNGFATLNEPSAQQYTVKILSIKFANGDDLTPYSGATESDNDIIITTETSANPDSATTSIRCYGYFSSSDIVSVGQCNGSSNAKTLQVGMLLRNDGNQTIQVGNGIYSSGGNSAQFGRQHINKQTDSLLAGFGHDNSNGRQGSSAVGLWSDITSNTIFAVGNGTSDSVRSNAFAVTVDGELVLKGKDGKDYKLYVDNTGSLKVEEVVGV